MKKLSFYFLVILAVIITGNGNVYSANEYFRSIASGNWNSTSTWEMSLNNSTWIPATLTPDATSNFITVRYPNVVTVTANVSVDQLGIDSGTISINNGIILTLLDGSGTDFTILKGGTVTGSGTFRNQGVAIVMNLRAGSNFNADLNVNTGLTYAYDLTSPYDGSLFGNVLIDAGATINGGNISGRHLAIFGNVINNGTMTASSTNGSYSINGSSLVNNGVITTAGILYFEDTTSVSGNGTFTPAGTVISGNVTLLSSITYAPSSYISINSGAALNPNSNILTLTSGTMIVNPNASVSAPGNVRTQGTVALNLRAGSNFNADLNVNTGTTYAYDQTSPYDGSLYGNVVIDAGATINGGNISGRALFINGPLTNNGTLTATSTGGSIRLKGANILNNGTVYSAGSLFFDTTTSISGTGSFTSLANLTANANLSINSNHQFGGIIINAGSSFNMDNRVVGFTLSNPITQNGTFSNANSDIIYNGTVLQTVSTTNINYVGLKINNPLGAILSNNITIPDTLAVILGDLNLNGKIITITPAGYMTETPGNTVFGTTGYITTTRNVGTPSFLNVAGIGAVLTASSNLGSTEIRRGHTVQTGLNGGTSIKRYYDITPANNSGLNATLVFKFDDSELNGKPEPSLKLFKSTNAGSTWLYEGGTVNISSNEITLSGLTSFSRWSSDSSGVSAAISTLMQGFYNNTTNQLSMSDTVRAYLRNTFSPYAIVDSSIGIIDSLTFRSPYQFPNAPNGNYYIQLKHRNSLETWSKFGVNYVTDTTLNYDFTFAATQAYGNNTILKGAKYCMYSGDVTQNGFIDLADVLQIYNNSTAFVNGYVVTDVNGDQITDLADVLIAYNNSINFVSAKTPLNP